MACQVKTGRADRPCLPPHLPSALSVSTARSPALQIDGNSAPACRSPSWRWGVTACGVPRSPQASEAHVCSTPCHTSTGAFHPCRQYRKDSRSPESLSLTQATSASPTAPLPWKRLGSDGILPIVGNPGK